MNIALDGTDHHLAELRRTGFGQQGAQNEHARLHGVGRKQDLGHEQDAVAEILTDDAHALDESLGQHVVGRPAAAEQYIRAFLNLFLQAVIEIVVHLQHQIFVGKFGEYDLFV